MPTESGRDWVTAGLREAKALEALEAVPGSELSSFFLELAGRRARARTPAEVLRQWVQDTFTSLSMVDLRQVLRVELRLLDAAAAFEAVELSPLAPLATCASVGLTSQNKIVSTMRGTEVVSDSTNVMALECARRLRRSPEVPVRLATCQRVVRAQAIPKKPGYAHHFKLFAMATAGLETKDHGFLVDALLEHIRALLAGLDALKQDGYSFLHRKVRLLATPVRASLADRMALTLKEEVEVVREPLEHPYYNGGLRFMLDVTTSEGNTFNLADGGAFDWVGKLTSNRRHSFVASGLGTQLLVLHGPRKEKP
jgi:hypothetical protein